MKPFLPISAIACAASFVALPAFAASDSADSIEEVVVYAAFHNDAALSLANSVTVMDGEQLQKRAAKHLEDIVNHVPNVNFSSGASRGRFFQIRGIGERSQFIEPINPSVGLMIDGVDFSGLAGAATLIDVDQVEVLRGPQGTLFGANALAGLINVVSQDPTETASGNATVEVGNYDALRLGGAVGGQITDGLGVRLAVESNESDGYYKNAYLGEDDTNAIDELTARFKLVANPNDVTEIRFTTLLVDVDNGYDAFTLDNSRVTISDQPGHDRIETTAYGFGVDFAGLDVFDVHVNLSQADSSTEYAYDEDWTFREVCPETSDCAYWQYSTFDAYAREVENTTADLRLVSKDGGSINWVVGVYQRDQEEALARGYLNNDPTYGTFYGPIDAPELSLFASYYETENTAVYGQVDWSLSDVLSLSTGLRREWRTANYLSSDGFDDRQSEALWGGRVALEYTGIDNTLVYGLVSRGYKAGGVNSSAALSDTYRNFDTEAMLNYELGIKGQWLGGDLTAQAVAFYQTRDDAQVKQSLVTSRATGDVFDGAANPCPCDFEDYVDNAAKVESQGVEIEAVYTPTTAVSLWLNLGLLQAEYEDFASFSHVDADAENGVSVDLAGRRIAQAPRYQYALGADFQLADNIVWEVSAEVKDSFYLSSRHEERSKQYTLYNSRVNLDLSPVTVSAWIKNVTDEDVIVRGFGSFGNNPANFYETEPYYQFGAPRTFGVTASYNF